jgi:hypothetical protein
LCGCNPVLSVTNNGLGYVNAEISCSHPKVGGQESRLTALGTDRRITVTWIIHDWNYVFGKGYVP